MSFCRHSYRRIGNAESKLCKYLYVAFTLFGDLAGVALNASSFVSEVVPILLYLSVVGNILIFCVGVNLVFGKKIRVANLLPAIIFAVIAAFLPIKLI